MWFYDMHADGLSLDDKRSPVKDNDIPDILHRFHNIDAEADRKRTDKSFLVPFGEIKANDWDLSINRYKEVEYEEVQYAPPADIIEEIRVLDHQKMEALKSLKESKNPLQNQFTERVQAIEGQKAKARTSLEKSEELFQSLLQRAFKG